MDTAEVVSDERVREVAREILSSPPYDLWTTGRSHALDRLIAWLADLPDRLNGVYLDSPALYWLILAGMVLLAVALIAHIVWSVRVALTAPEARPRAAPADAPPRWSEEAHELAARGWFLEATHRLALGSVQSLVEGGHIELLRSDPNRVLRERIGRAALPEDLSRDFLRLLDRFEQGWFRDRREDATLYRAWQDLYRRIVLLEAPGR